MKVSICIPVYKVRRYINRCLESVVDQTYSDLEIIVVNDCTPDDSMAVVEEFARNDSRIKVINHESNKGLMMARRTAYKVAEGDFITFCDSDDCLPSNAIELLLSAAVDNGADIVAGGITYIDNNNNTSFINSVLKYGEDKVSVYKSLLKKEVTHNLCAKLFKNALLQSYDYKTFLNFTNGEDGCLFYQVVENSKRMVSISQPVYYYYQNSDSSTQIRLTEQAVNSIARLNRIRVDCCKGYSEIEKYLRRYVFMAYKELEWNGYNKEGLLSQSFLEQDLLEYISLKENWTSLSLYDLTKVIIKRILWC